MSEGLRVLVDATAVPSDRGGVGRYVDALLPALAELGVDLTVVCQLHDATLVSALVPRADLLTVPARVSRRPVRLAWEQTGLPRLVRRVRPDVLLSPHYTMPWRVSVPVVVTLHDATFFSHPELHSPLKARFFRSAIRSAVRSADALVVPSRATAQEVSRFTSAPPERFHVAYHGVDAHRFHPVDADERERVRRTLDIGDLPYVGFLGTLEPRKNVPALVRAWDEAVRGTRDPVALVLAGGAGWDDQIEPAVAAVSPGLVVRLPGYLPLDDLPGFLGGASVVAYPSLGEGFGLPVLEAMACGAAVLTSRELSLPEVGGDAVAYAGTSAGEIRDGLRALLDDPERRAALAEAAVARAATFTWASAARVHVEAFESALRRKA